MYLRLVGTSSTNTLAAHHRSDLAGLTSLRASLIKDSSTIFQSTLVEWQKLDAYRCFLFPRVSFILKVMYPGSTWCRKLDTLHRGIIKKGLHIPNWACSDNFYLSQGLGGMGVPCVEDESHIARVSQAFKFLADQRDPTIRAVALHQLAATMSKRARHLDPTNLEDMSLFLNTPPHTGEGRAGDLHSIWSAVRKSLALPNTSISISEDSLPWKVWEPFVLVRLKTTLTKDELSSPCHSTPTRTSHTQEHSCPFISTFLRTKRDLTSFL